MSTPRNAPCPCGSEKKYKQCCGMAPASTSSSSTVTIATGDLVAQCGHVTDPTAPGVRIFGQWAPREAPRIRVDGGGQREVQWILLCATCFTGCGGDYAKPGAINALVFAPHTLTLNIGPSS